MRYLVFLVTLIFIPIVFSINCVLRSNSCNPGEFCLFSRYQQDNSHAGNCSAYSFLTCCSDSYLQKAEVKSSCDLGENGTISMFNYTNAHAEIFTAGNYNYKVCVSCPWFCSLRTNCLSDEYNLASLNANTNSHIASPGYFDLQVCCKREDVLPTVSNVGQNTSSIQPGQAVKIYSFWQDNGNLSHAILETNETGDWQNKSVYGSPLSIKANSGWSNFTWQNSSISNRVVSWRIYANDSCGNWQVTSINSFSVQANVLTQCQDIISSGSYILLNDVFADETCFNISASFVDLDCKGKKIYYAQSTSGNGILIDKSNNVRVSNCKIFGGENNDARAIYIYKSNYTIIEENNISTNRDRSYGIYIEMGSNNSLYINNISTSGYEAHGVFIEMGSNNSLYINNISTSGIDSSGVYLYYSSNNTVEMNNINTSDYGSDGIYIAESINNQLSKNNFYTYIGNAIYVSGDSIEKFNHNIDQTNTEYGKPILYFSNKNNLIIENNDTIGQLFVANSNYVRIRNVSLDKDGILFVNVQFSNITESNLNTVYGAIAFVTSYNNNVKSNNINTSGYGSDGIYVGSGASYNHFEENNISTFGDNSHAINIFWSSYNNFKKNNLTTNGFDSAGAYFVWSSNINFTNNIIKSSSHGFYIYENSLNILIINSTINANDNDIRFGDSGNIKIINTTFNKSSVFWEPTVTDAWINVSYYVDVLVRNFTDSIDSAQVNITNYTNSLVFSGYTNSNGYIETQLLPEFFANGSYSYTCPSSQANLTCASPYNFSASKGGLFNSTIESINQSKTVEIILFEKILTMSLSQKLSEGIFYTSINGSQNNTQMPIEVDKWNNATWNYNNTPQLGDKKTLYWIYNDGNINQDFCIKANADLTCGEGSCIGNIIPIMNVAFTNSTQNDEQNPSFSDQNRLSTNFIKIARNVQPQEYIYFRFWLYGNLTGKPSGIYNTTYTVRNVESGGDCQ